MSKATLKLNTPKVEPKVTFETALFLEPYLVTSLHMKEGVLIKVPVDAYCTYVAVVMEEGKPLMWASSFEDFEFIRPLTKDEAVVITG